MKTTITKIITILIVGFTTLTSLANGISNMIVPPENDLIENATNLALEPLVYVSQDVNFNEATSPGDGGQQGCTTGVAGIWYKFTATAAGSIGAGIINPSQPIVVFYSAPNEDVISGQELTHVDQGTNPCANGSVASIETTIGTTYYIFMKNDITSNVFINSTDIFAVPENDLVSDAISLNGLEDYVDSDVHYIAVTNNGDNGATNCDTGDARAVWYKFTAAIEGQVVVGIDLPPALAGVVFYSAANENATSGADLTWVDQNTNPCSPNTIASIITTPGTTYYIMAGIIDHAPYGTISVNLSGILGTSENVLEGFSYYPNPVTNEINLSSTTSIDEVRIHNILGKQLYAEEMNATNKRIDLSNLASGMYILTVSAEGISGSYKIIKQ